MAFRQSSTRKSSAIMQEFIDPSYLSNKRPAIPGGAWPKDLLRRKSFADLQQLWFALVKEKNMLATTKHHYVVHQEELGAFPAPNRVLMVDESMSNIKAVVQERDFEATDRAVAIFRERLQKGVYRYPPGPQPPADYGVEESTVRIVLSKKVSVDRLRELFGKYDVFEEHKGIAGITLRLTNEALAQKRRAEGEWKSYIRSKRAHDGFHAFDKVDSIFDHASVEIAPGVYGHETVRAVDVEVPESAVSGDMPTKPLERLRWLNKSRPARSEVNYSYYPIRSSEAPEAPMERPTHPDEIEGPWIATITYDKADGYGYAMGLEISSIDGAAVQEMAEVPFTEPYASRCPIYREAKMAEEADVDNAHTWPHIPEWKSQYSNYSKKKIADIIMHNYSNVVDYVDREVLLTGKSSWEMPIPIDTSCGSAFTVPAHAKPNRQKNFSMKDFIKL